MNPLLKAALVKVGAECNAATVGFKKKASWYDLSPAVRRAIVGAGVGTAAGAGIGAVADEDSRGRGAAVGAAGGGLLGAGGGLLYNKLRPIKPAAMPGIYDAEVGASVRGRGHDYTVVVKPANAEALHFTAPHVKGRRDGVRWDIEGDPAFHGLPARDPQGRKITVNPKVWVQPELGHLAPDESVMKDDKMKGWIGDELRSRLRPSGLDYVEGMDEVGGELLHNFGGARKMKIKMTYPGTLDHVPGDSSELNEMRRLLRIEKKSVEKLASWQVLSPAARRALVGAGVGAATGASIGAFTDKDNRWRGAAVGAAGGGLLGAKGGYLSSILPKVPPRPTRVTEYGPSRWRVRPIGDHYYDINMAPDDTWFKDMAWLL